MEYGRRVGRYIEILNGFQFNSVRAVLNLNRPQLAKKLNITPMTIVYWEKSPLTSPIVCDPKSYNNLHTLIKESCVYFPDSKTVKLKNNISSLHTLLTGMQYKISIFLLYDLHNTLSSAEVSFLDTYFRNLDNSQPLEEATKFINTVKALRTYFEDSGLEFPDSTTVVMKHDLTNKSINREKLNLILNEEASVLAGLTLRQVKLLLILFPRSLWHEEIELNYEQLPQVLGINSSLVKRAVLSLEKQGVLFRNKKYIKTNKMTTSTFVTLLDKGRTILDSIELDKIS